jgi:dTDP-4-dehydrorhamnose reductase
MDYFVIGSSGFLGTACVRVLRQQGYSVFESRERLTSPILFQQIVDSGAKFVICAAGITGTPSTDWCDQHESETFHANYVGVLNLITITATLNIHTTVFGSSYIFSGGRPIYTEDDKGDMNYRVYSKWKIELEKVVPFFPHVLYLRIGPAITLDGHPKCFMSKMIGRASSVHPVSTALTVVPDMFPKISLLCEAGAHGIYNFVNDGTISLVRLLTMYSEKRERIEVNVSTQGEARGGYELSMAKLKAITEVRNVEDAIYAHL